MVGRIIAEVFGMMLVMRSRVAVSLVKLERVVFAWPSSLNMLPTSGFGFHTTRVCATQELPVSWGAILFGSGPRVQRFKPTTWQVPKSGGAHLHKNPRTVFVLRFLESFVL